MNKIIIIGIGSTGLDILEQAQQYYYEFTKKAMPENIQMMFVETDVNRKPKHTPDGKVAIRECYIKPDNIKASLESWRSKDKDDWQWLPDEGTALSMGIGAGGQSAFGRMALWAKASDISDRIKEMHAGGNSETKVLIVGSFTGGTGSGIFLDLAYLVRNETTTSHIYGMFVLPDRSRQSDANFYFNTYASLRSMDRYMKAQRGNYHCELPNGNSVKPISSDYAPFEWVQFLTSDFSNGNASMSFGSLKQSAGFNLVLRLLDVNHQTSPMIDELNKRWVDYVQLETDSPFQTVGFIAYQYPERLLEEYFAAQLVEKQLLERWADNDHYIDSHGSKQSVSSVETRIKTTCRRFVEQMIKEVVGSELASKGYGMGANLAEDLQSEVSALMSGDGIPGDKQNYIWQLFNADQSDKIYAYVHGRETDMRDMFIDKIVAYVEGESSNFQNLKVVGIVIDKIISAIEEILKDWKGRYHIEGDSKTWNVAWRRLFESRFTGALLYSAFASKREWYLEALQGSLWGLLLRRHGSRIAVYSQLYEKRGRCH